MWRGEYYFRHLRFEDKGFDGDTRYIRFSLTYNGTYLYIDTPDFEIYGKFSVCMVICIVFLFYFYIVNKDSRKVPNRTLYHAYNAQ